MARQSGPEKARRNVSGSENRKLKRVVSFRIGTDEVADALDAYAVRLGFKNANDLARYRLAGDLEAALASTNSDSGALATAS